MTMDVFLEKMNEVLDDAEFEMDSDLKNIDTWDSLAYLAFMTVATIDGKKVMPSDVRSAKKVMDLYNMVRDDSEV